jgi:hypothetical protein
MIDLTPSHFKILERLVDRDFSVVAFPLYANAVGIRKGNCAALVEPLAGGGFQLYGEPCFLLDGNLTARVTQNGRSWFVWKKQRVEATAERLAELSAFISELKSQLELRV